MLRPTYKRGFLWLQMIKWFISNFVMCYKGKEKDCTDRTPLDPLRPAFLPCLCSGCWGGSGSRRRKVGWGSCSAGTGQTCRDQFTVKAQQRTHASVAVVWVPNTAIASGAASKVARDLVGSGGMMELIQYWWGIDGNLDFKVKPECEINLVWIFLFFYILV